MLPSDSKSRKDIPLVTGCYDYFPRALAAVAQLSKLGNDKHNPGQPLHWSRGLSNDHADCIGRHLQDRGTPDSDMGGMSHSVAVAWRALALLEEELEDAECKEADDDLGKYLTENLEADGYWAHNTGEPTYTWKRYRSVDAAARGRADAAVNWGDEKYIHHTYGYQTGPVTADEMNRAFADRPKLGDKK